MPRPMLVPRAVGAMLTLSMPAVSQVISDPVREQPDKNSGVISVVGCTRPEDAKAAKVVDLDTGKSVARLAVQLGSSRFKLVRITVWDSSDDPRPLAPVIEAARIIQGTIYFYAPDLNTDPESAHGTFLLTVNMGGSDVCWATPSTLIDRLAQEDSGRLPKPQRSVDPLPQPPELTLDETRATSPPIVAPAEPEAERTSREDRPARRSRTPARAKSKARQ
jgi:hypothetical protein